MRTRHKERRPGRKVRATSTPSARRLLLFFSAERMCALPVRIGLFQRLDISAFRKMPTVARAVERVRDRLKRRRIEAACGAVGELERRVAGGSSQAARLRAEDDAREELIDRVATEPCARCVVVGPPPKEAAQPGSG